jgi:hypothetical protein
MAINADQLLNRPSELHRRYGGRLAMQKAQQEKMVGGGPSNIVLSKKSIKGIEGIKINVIKIEDILKGSLALDKKQLDDKKKATSRKRKDDIETKLETKPNAESGGKVKLPAAPRMGILDWIKNFIGNVLLGYFAVRLIKHLPKIMPFVKFLGNAADFIIDIGGKLLNGLVTFIDIGYKAYDATRGFIKNLGGENFAKGFDKFIGAIDTALFLTTVLAGSLAMEALTGGGGGGPGGGKGGGPLKSGKQIYKEYDQKRAFIRKKHGDAAARIYDNEISNGKTPKQAFENLKNRYISKGRITSQRALGLGEIKGSKLFDKGFDKAPGRLATRILGRSGKKAILGVVRPLLKRLPIIGALIDFGLSVALGEDPGRAAFKAIGAALLGTVGTAIGSLAFGFGGIVGGILGSIGGDALGGALYDTFFGGKKPQQNGKVQGKAGGGITRGGKSAGGVKRTVSKGKYKRTIVKIPRKPSKTEFKDKEVKKSTEELDKTKYFGPILAISSKIMNKEEPTDRDYQNVGLGINMLIAKGIQDKQLKGGIVAKFAEGGLVDPDVLSAAETGGDISNWVAKTFRGEIESNAEKTMRLMKEMRENLKERSCFKSNEQGPIVNVIAEFNKLKGVKPVELITGRTDPGGHGDHVHVAYAKGGRVYKKTFAMLGEKGTPEFVFDYDTTRGLDSLAPRLLDKLNRAKTKPQLARILEFYAPKSQSPDVASFPSYNEMSEASQTFIVQSSPPPPPSDDYGSGGGGGGGIIASGGSGFADKLYKGDG